MTSIAIVYHSGYGHTEAQAKALAAGVRGVAGTTAILIRVQDIELYWDDLHAADAIVFGSPTYMGNVSAAFKVFMEATSSRAFVPRLWKDKLAAGFTNSGGLSGDKLATLTALSLFAAQHGMLWIGVDYVPGDANNPADLNRLCGFVGAMAQSGMTASPETDPPSGDKATATYLGHRVALAALRWSVGKPQAEEPNHAGEFLMAKT
jgi:NAD(P)H dehydrogenase (quinone)